jgi:serine protease Do
VASVIPQLQKNGQVARGWLGVQTQSVTGEIAESLGLKTTAGALVSEPQVDSPAAKAGIRSGDVITSVDKIEVKDPRDLARMIAGLGPDKAVALGIVRDGEGRTITVKLGQIADQKVRKTSAGDHSGHQLGSLGLIVAPAADVEGAWDMGLAVLGVDPNGKASELGLRKGDVILKAGNMAVCRPQDLAAGVSAAKAAGRKNTLIMVKRDQAILYVALPVAIS